MTAVMDVTVDPDSPLGNPTADVMAFVSNREESFSDGRVLDRHNGSVEIAEASAEDVLVQEARGTSR